MATTIGQRLAMGFGLVLAFLAVIAISSVVRMNSVTEEIQALMDRPLTKERLVSDWYANVNAGVRRTAAIARSSDTALIEFFAADVKEASTISSRLQGDIERLMSTPKEQALFEKIGEYRKTFIKTRDEISDLKKGGRTDEALAKLNNEFRPASDAYLSGMREMQALQRSEIDELSAELRAANQLSSRAMAVLGALAVIASAVAGWFITRSITAPMERALLLARRVADGDLTQRLKVSGKDEVAQLLAAMGHMRDRLASVVGHVRMSAEQVAHASKEIALGNNDLSQRTEQQAAHLQETASTMEELGSTARQSASRAATARQLATDACEIALRGGTVVHEAIEAMNQINASSKQIGDITGVIDGLAFQTNILALNAAVEAARAGEHGRGFAVVAEEVRNLAHRSAQASREIRDLIAGSIKTVAGGAELVHQAGTTMDEIVSSVQNVNQIVNEISVASKEQSEGVNQVGSTLTNMDRVTQQNAALVEQSAAAASSLEEQSRDLVAAVAIFKVSPAE